MNHDATYQTLVANWMNTVFEGQGGKDIQTRCFRFLEEALELVQALGCTKDEALQMVEYTFARPVGEPVQEVGGTLITLMALCTQAKIDAQEAGYIELRRVWQPEVMEKIRAKQKNKPHRGPLPGVEAQPVYMPFPPPACSRCHGSGITRAGLTCDVCYGVGKAYP